MSYHTVPERKMQPVSSVPTYAANDLTENGTQVQQSFDALCQLCQHYGRRLLMRPAVMCKCPGADEVCFANVTATAAEGERENAMLITTLLMHTEWAPVVTALATEFGLALKRMTLNISAYPDGNNSGSVTLHQGLLARGHLL